MICFHLPPGSNQGPRGADVASCGHQNLESSPTKPQWKIQAARGVPGPLSLSTPVWGGQEERGTPTGHVHPLYGLRARNPILKTICPMEFHAVIDLKRPREGSQRVLKNTWKLGQSRTPTGVRPVPDVEFSIQDLALNYPSPIWLPPKSSRYPNSLEGG